VSTLQIVAITVGACTVFTAGVTAMPSPVPTDGKFYRWSFGSLHILAGAIPRFVAIFLPQYAKFFGATDQNLQAKCDTLPEKP
jgi:hypothetical protein